MGHGEQVFSGAGGNLAHVASRSMRAFFTLGRKGVAMIRETNNRLLVATGLALLLVVGVVLPLRVARALQPVDLPEGQPAMLQAMTVFTTFAPPPPTATSTFTPTESPEPTDAVTPTDTTEVTTPTATLSPTVEVIPTQPTDTPEPPTDTPSPPTVTPEPTPVMSATQEPSPTGVPTAAPETPKPTEAPVEPTPTLTIPQVLEQNWQFAAGGCVVLLFLFLGLMLIILGLRRRKPKPPPTPPPPAPRLQAAPGPYLESVSVAGEAGRFALDPEGTTIGRAPENGVVITQEFAGWETVSRTHARVYREGERWLVEDNNSKNGVWVNGRRTGHNLLQDGWKLGIGGVEFVFRAGAGEAES
jgi:hypothetical protein